MIDKFLYSSSMITAASVVDKAKEATKNALYNRIVAAFDPLIQVMQAMAYPLTFLMAGSGVLLIILGKKHKGITTIKWAAIGYILMQWLPALMQILRDVGEAMMP